MKALKKPIDQRNRIYVAEVYMYDETGTIPGWDIDIKTVYADSKKEAREMILSQHRVDCIIAWNVDQD